MLEVIAGMLERLEGACALIEELLEALLAAKEQNERLRGSVKLTQERVDRLNAALWRLTNSVHIATVWEVLLGEGAGEIDALIRRGQRIEAIKRIRKLTGLGLRGCRDLADVRAAHLRPA